MVGGGLGGRGDGLQTAKLRTLTDFWLGFTCSARKTSRTVELIKSLKTRNDEMFFLNSTAVYAF